MTHYLIPNRGTNFTWKCAHSNLNNKANLTSDKFNITFKLSLKEGAEGIVAPLPDILLWAPPCRIPGLVDQGQPFIIGSEDLIDFLVQQKSTSFSKFNIAFENYQDLVLKKYSILIFEKHLNQLTFFPKTKIEFINLADFSTEKIIEGYCENLEYFDKKLNDLMAAEKKIFKFQTYSIPGDNQFYGFGQNSVIVTTKLKDMINNLNLDGVSIIPNKDFNIVNLT